MKFYKWKVSYASRWKVNDLSLEIMVPKFQHAVDYFWKVRMPQTQWKFSMPPVDSSQLTVKSKLVFQSMKFERNVQTFKVGFKTVKVWLQRCKCEEVLLNKKFRCDCFSSDAPRRLQPGAKAMFCPIRTRCSRRFTSALLKALRAVCLGVRCRGGSSTEILSDTALLQVNWNTI